MRRKISPKADIVIMESTYGDRLHDSYDDARKKLRDAINRTARQRGAILPAFAVGRTQGFRLRAQSARCRDIPDIRFLSTVRGPSTPPMSFGCTRSVE